MPTGAGCTRPARRVSRIRTAYPHLLSRRHSLASSHHHPLSLRSVQVLERLDDGRGRGQDARDVRVHAQGEARDGDRHVHRLRRTVRGRGAAGGRQDGHVRDRPLPGRVFAAVHRPLGARRQNRGAPRLGHRDHAQVRLQGPPRLASHHQSPSPPGPVTWPSASVASRPPRACAPFSVRRPRRAST